MKMRTLLKSSWTLSAAYCIGVVTPLSSCSLFNKDEVVQNKIQIKLPEKTSAFGPKSLSKIAQLKLKNPSAKQLSNFQNQSSSQNSMWDLEEQTKIGESDCYAVYLQGHDLEAGSCLSSNGAQILPISRFFGLYSAGQTISLDVPIGDQRTLGFFAFMSADGKCESAFDKAFNSQKYSHPLWVGGKTQKIDTKTSSVDIEISMQNAVAYESCSGKVFSDLAGSTWPACNLNVAEVGYRDGQVHVSGSCLGAATRAVLVNSNTSEKIDLKIASQSSRVMELNPSTQRTQILGKTLYRLLLSNAQGQIADVPFTMTLDNVMTFPYLKTANGTIVGDILPFGSASMGGGNTFLVNTSSGEALNYISIKGGYDTSKLYLMPAFLSIAPSINMSNLQLARNGMMPYPQSWVQFSGADCTGDIVLSYYNTVAPPRGTVVVQPKGCTQSSGSYGGTVWTCSGWDYFRLSGAPTPSHNVTVNSYLSTGYGPDMAASGTFSYCYNNSSSSPPVVTDAFVYSASQKIPFGAGDPAVVIENATIEGR